MRALTVLATLGLLSFASAGQAATVTVGPQSLSGQASATTCGGSACHGTFVQAALDDPGIVASPGDGNVVAWRVIGTRADVSNSYICPVVVHPPVAGKYTSGAHLSATSTACGNNVPISLDGTLNQISAPLPVQAGDLIGADVATTGPALEIDLKNAPMTAASRLTFDPTIGTAPQGPSGNVTDQLMMNFEVQIAAPAITQLSPASGDGNTQVTISGEHLANATGVMFGALAGTIVSNTNTQIVAVAPSGNQGTVDVAVTTLGGSATAPFAYPSPAPPAGDTTAPVLSSLVLSPKTFRAANIGGSVAVAVGGRVRYSVSEAGTVTFTVLRLVSGHKRGGRCRAGGRTGKRCTLVQKVKGSFTRAAAAGQDQFRFTARVGGRALKRGRYRLTAIAKDTAGNASTPSRATFTVVK
jgi:hypothetical protein